MCHALEVPHEYYDQAGTTDASDEAEPMDLNSQSSK